MATQSIIQRTFAGGELAPILHARGDTTKYLSGLRTCRNFLVRREGGVTRRPGLRYVAGARDDAAGKKLLRYLGTTATTGVLIEAGSGYFRFIYQGALVTVTSVAAWSGGTAYVPGDLASLNGLVYYCFLGHTNHTPPDGTYWAPLNFMIAAGAPLDVHLAAAYSGVTAYVPGDLVYSANVIYRCIANTTGNAPPNATFWVAITVSVYEVPSPYGGVVPIFKWYQTGNVIVLTQPGQKPRELVFSSVTRWVLQDVSTAPSIAAPTGLAGVAGAAGALTYRYIVTALVSTPFEESNPSNIATIAADALPTTALPNTLTWTAVGAATGYHVYCDPRGNGTYGFLGLAATNAFNDVGSPPDFSLTPPMPRVLFNATNSYPDNAATYQQRRFYANTNLMPDDVEGSRTGLAANFGITSPIQDDNAISFRVAGNGHHPVRAMVALKAGLVLLTDGGEWTVTGAGGPMTALTPTSINTDQETYVGVDANVRPVVIGAAIVYLQARGSIVRELAFTPTANGGLVAAGRDLTIFASHLFEGFTVVAQDFQQVPDSIIWCVRSDGVLLGLTYIPEEDVWGWHRHDTTDGLFADVCVVPEGTGDVLYCLINRQTKWSIEKLETRVITNFNQDAFFVDCGLTYVGAPATVISGIPNVIDGYKAAILADGVVVSDGNPVTGTITITGGTVTIPNAASVVHVGIPIRFAEIETLDLDVHGSQIRDVKKRVDSVSLLLSNSGRAFSAGPDSANLSPNVLQAFDPAGNLFSGLLELGTISTFTPYGRVFIRVTDPLPLTVLGVLPNVGLGG